MKTRSILISSLIMLGLIVLPLRVLAHGDTSSSDDHASQQEAEYEQRQAKLEQRRQQAEARLQAAQARRCEFVKTRIEFHRDRAAAIREHRKERYQHIVDRLNALADRLDVKGVDSTELRDSVVKLSELIETYSTTYTDYESALQDVLNQVCEDDEDADVKVLVKEARSLLVRLHSNAESIHTFFQDDLKPVLADIRQQLQAENENQTN